MHYIIAYIKFRRFFPFGHEAKHFRFDPRHNLIGLPQNGVSAFPTLDVLAVVIGITIDSLCAS
ncbi:MAG: hypothetical protein ACTSRS_11695 [Candidatus Helarchaeota archaeon]